MHVKSAELWIDGVKTTAGCATPVRCENGLVLGTLPPLTGTAKTRTFVIRVVASASGGMTRRLYLVGTKKSRAVSSERQLKTDDADQSLDDATTSLGQPTPQHAMARVSRQLHQPCGERAIGRRQQAPQPPSPVR